MHNQGSSFLKAKEGLITDLEVAWANNKTGKSSEESS